MITEPARVRTLQGYGVLDTPNEPAFDAIVRDMARVFEVKSALVSFIDSNRQWYKAKVGVEADWVPRSISFCTHSIESDAVTVVPDATRDPRFCRNPFVSAPGGIRFYAAAPIRALNRARVGTVCIFDVRPRDALTPRQRLQLSGYAARVVELLVKR